MRTYVLRVLVFELIDSNSNSISRSNIQLKRISPLHRIATRSLMLNSILSMSLHIRKENNFDQIALDVVGMATAVSDTWLRVESAHVHDKSGPMRTTIWNYTIMKPTVNSSNTVARWTPFNQRRTKNMNIGMWSAEAVQAIIVLLCIMYTSITAIQCSFGRRSRKSIGYLFI